MADGDLDPHMSRHTLVPLKVAYKKLRLLVDLGCVFIGHGLKKDFRIISMLLLRFRERIMLTIFPKISSSLQTESLTRWTYTSLKHDSVAYRSGSFRGSF